MKLIEKGEPIDFISNTYKISHHFLNSPIVEDGVTYLVETTVKMLDKDNVQYTHRIKGKKSDFICGDCGTNFISHKGMCSSCYVKQL